MSLQSYMDTLADVDKALLTIENKPFERMAKLEQEKLKIVQDSVKGGTDIIRVDIRMPLDGPGDESPATRRRNKFKALLGKYSDKPLGFDDTAKASKDGVLPNSTKATAYMKLKELDKMH